MLNSIWRAVSRVCPLVVGVLLATACGEAGSVVSQPTVVPWISTVAGPAPFPTATSSSGLTSCEAAELTVRAGQTTAGGGTIFRSLVFTDVGPSGCELSGVPQIALIDSRGSPVSAQSRVADPSSSSGAIALGPGIPPGTAGAQPVIGQALLVVGVPTNMCAPNPVVAASITVAAGQTLQVPFAIPASIDSTCVPAEVVIAHFSGPGQDVTTSPQPDFTVTYFLPASALSGQTLNYEVKLTNVSGHAINFASCPGYTEALKIAQVAQRFVLNCTPVGSLMPNAAATFAMRFAIPTSESFKQVASAPVDQLTWTIDPPYVTINSGSPGAIVVGRP